MKIEILSIETIMRRIGLDVRTNVAANILKRSADFWTACDFDIHIAITTDPVETNHDFAQRYGAGLSYDFSLSSYDEGRTLAQALYNLAKGICPDVTNYTGSQFKQSDLLSLFVYITDICKKNTVETMANQHKNDYPFQYSIN